MSTRQRQVQSAQLYASDPRVVGGRRLACIPTGRLSPGSHTYTAPLSRNRCRLAAEGETRMSTWPSGCRNRRCAELWKWIDRALRQLTDPVAWLARPGTAKPQIVASSAKSSDGEPLPLSANGATFGASLSAEASPGARPRGPRQPPSEAAPPACRDPPTRCRRRHAWRHALGIRSGG